MGVVVADRSATTMKLAMERAASRLEGAHAHGRAFQDARDIEAAKIHWGVLKNSLELSHPLPIDVGRGDRAPDHLP